MGTQTVVLALNGMTLGELAIAINGQIDAVVKGEAFDHLLFAVERTETFSPGVTGSGEWEALVTYRAMRLAKQ